MLPAGWYTDPGQSGGKRWWDGSKWTEHLRMPEKTAPAAAAPQSTPYGISTIHQPGYVPTTNSANPTHSPTYQAPLASDTRPVSNLLAWIALVLGLAAIGMTVVTLLPGSPLTWVCAVGGLATLVGLLAISHRVRNRATNLWAPILGVLFGLSATAVTLLGINMIDLVNSATGGLLPTSGPTSVQTASPLRPVSQEPFVFASNASLTEDGTEVQQIATALNEDYASGNSSLADGQAWPKFLRFTATQVLAESGTPIATVAPGHFFTYQLSQDARSYTFTVTSGNRSESAIYNSATNRFTFACPATDSTCVPSS